MEMELNGAFAENVVLEIQQVVYEWKPLKCKGCSRSECKEYETVGSESMGCGEQNRDELRRNDITDVVIKDNEELEENEPRIMVGKWKGKGKIGVNDNNIQRLDTGSLEEKLGEFGLLVMPD